MVVNSDLPYPEGRAAAEILKVGSEIRKEEANGEDTSKKETGMKDIVGGTALAGLFSLCSNGFHVVSSEFSYWLSFGKAVTQIPLGFSTALLGAGYLIGIASGMAILVGTLLAWYVFVPYLTSVITPAEGQSAAAFAKAIWAQKVRFIGAGCIGIAAVWTLIRLAKPVVDGIKMSINALRANDTEEKKILHHTDIDMSPKSVGLVFLAILIGLFITFYTFVSNAGLSSMSVTLMFIVVGILVATLMGFFVAAACGYMAGLIGTSASPISGIGILGIIVSSLVVLGIGSSAGVFETMQGTQFATAFAIFITSVIVSIASISNDNLQDLKTGYLVGATPWKQQVALILGSIIGSFAIAPVLNLLYQAYGFTGALPRAGMDPTQALAAPQATLMTTIAQGIFSASLDWNYILFGVGVGIAAIIIDLILTKNTKSLALPPLAVGMGIYLPPTLEIPLVIGSVMGYLIHKSLKARAARRSPGHEEEDVEACNHRGVLFASGLIVGESLMGVIIALLIVVSVTSGGSENPLALVGKDFQSTADILGLLCFIAMIAIFVRHILITKFNPEDAESK